MGHRYSSIYLAQQQRSRHLSVREADTHLYLRCWMVPRHLKVPFTMMANRVQSASHSSMLVEHNNNNNNNNNNSHQSPFFKHSC